MVVGNDELQAMRIEMLEVIFRLLVILAHHQVPLTGRSVIRITIFIVLKI